MDHVVLRVFAYCIFYDALVLERYLRRLLEMRNEEIKRVAESDAWRGVLQLRRRARRRPLGGARCA
jgi:hypothetical protein